MAIIDLKIWQSNIEGENNILAVDSPLKFTAYLQHSSPAPYTFPDYILVDVVDDSNTYTYKAYQYQKIADKCYYIFFADKIFRALIGGLDDEPQSIGTVINVNNAKEFTVRFKHDTFSLSFNVIGYRCSKQNGDSENLVDLQKNFTDKTYDFDSLPYYVSVDSVATQKIFSFKDREFYLYYMFLPKKENQEDTFTYNFIPVSIIEGYNNLMTRIKAVGGSFLSSIVTDKPKDYYFIYGRLYSGNIANSTYLISPQNVAEGWRVPNTSHWNNMLNYIGNNVLLVETCRQINSIIPGCDATDHPRWEASIVYPTNQYELGIAPSGIWRKSTGHGLLGEKTAFWTSSPSPNTAIYFSRSEAVFENEPLTDFACPIKLVRDAKPEEYGLPDGHLENTHYYSHEGYRIPVCKIGWHVWTIGNLIDTTGYNGTPLLTLHPTGDIKLPNDNELYVAAEYVDTFGKRFNIEVLPDNPCGLFVKFLDSKTGYYKHWLFNKFYAIEGNHKTIGVVENFALTLADSSERSIGRKTQRKIMVTTDDMPIEHVEYIEGLFSSPRIYYQNSSGDWILVDLEDGSYPVKFRKFNTGSFSFTLVEPEQNSITML